MDFTEVRRLVIIAMFSDDVLLDKLVLKGGNALSIIHKIGGRSSLDVDFSIQGDFDDSADIARRIFKALKDRFDSAGHVVFDEQLVHRPSGAEGSRWGGYRVEFKIIDRAKYDALGRDLETVRRDALVIAPLQGRTLRVEISKYEYCDRKEEVELESFTIYVYSRAMIAAEKLRAICQQMPVYALNRAKTARARDFYDLHALVTEGGVDLSHPENLALVASIFAAKEVPLKLLAQIEEHREFHRADWPSVRDTVTGELRDFDYYFDFVLRDVERLQSLWMIDPPNGI